jgi:hypothetical protein
MGASSIGNAPNQPAHHGPAYPTRPTREPDPVTGAPRHPFRTSNRPHRAPLSDPKSPVQNRSTFSPPLLVLQFLLLAPSVTPPLRIRSATAIRGGVWAVAIPPVLVVRPPGAHAVRSVHRSPSSSFLEDSTITTFHSTLQRAAALR